MTKPASGTPEYEVYNDRFCIAHKAQEWMRLYLAKVAQTDSREERISMFHDANNTLLNFASLFNDIMDGAHVHFCTMCGKPERANYIEPKRTKLKKECLCFGCDFWADKRTAYNAQNRRGKLMVYRGQVLSDAGHQEGQRSMFLGFGGSVWYIHHLLTGQTFRSNNVWSGGEIPKEFRGGMPDNIVVLTKEQYEQIMAYEGGQ